MASPWLCLQAALCFAEAFLPPSWEGRGSPPALVGVQLPRDGEAVFAVADSGCDWHPGKGADGMRE